MPGKLAYRRERYLVAGFSRRQRSEQNLTSLQFEAHFRRHANGSPQDVQILLGRSAFLIIFGMSLALSQIAGKNRL
jgi:hypothetical protein